MSVSKVAVGETQSWQLQQRQHACRRCSAASLKLASTRTAVYNTCPYTCFRYLPAPPSSSCIFSSCEASAASRPEAATGSASASSSASVGSSCLPAAPCWEAALCCCAVGVCCTCLEAEAEAVAEELGPRVERSRLTRVWTSLCPVTNTRMPPAGSCLWIWHTCSRQAQYELVHAITLICISTLKRTCSLLSRCCLQGQQDLHQLHAAAHRPAKAALPSSHRETSCS